MRYTVIWEFRVAPGAEAAFMKHYGPDGDWAALFRRDPSYVETLLLADTSDPLRFLTIDRWTSHAAYEAFRSAYADAYEALDEVCEGFTVHEAALGSYYALP